MHSVLMLNIYGNLDIPNLKKNVVLGILRHCFRCRNIKHIWNIKATELTGWKLQSEIQRTSPLLAITVSAFADSTPSPKITSSVRASRRGEHHANAAARAVLAS